MTAFKNGNGLWTSGTVLIVWVAANFVLTVFVMDGFEVVNNWLTTVSALHFSSREKTRLVTKNVGASCSIK